MKIIAFIPVRYDSTRFPGKPLALISGNPMIQHAYKSALLCHEFSDVFVATDDERILNCVHEFGGKTIITAKNHPSGTDRIAEAVQKMSLDKDDLVVNIQGDQPYFEPSSITQMITPLMEDSGIQMSSLKYRLTDEKEVKNTNNVKVVTDKEGFALFFSRYPIPFYRNPKSVKIHYKHLGFYAYRHDFLHRFASFPVGQLESAEKLEQLRVLENGCRIKMEDSPSDSVEVDTPEDIKKVEEMIARLSPNRT
jgi:3-deoxy-manno-octulosonate cytidylyltransferase (CMP-KDO synthetase)